MLSPDQIRLRDGKVTASFLPKLMAGDNDGIVAEWRRLVGDPDYVPENLDDSWPVQFGSYIETFALDWHERKTGKDLTRRGEVVTHPERPFFSCTLDAFRPSDRTAIDCKAPGMWRKLDDVVVYYTPQMVGQRACVGADKASLLIVHGGSEPVEYPVEWTPDYEAEVWARVDQFYECVQNLCLPVHMQAVAAPVPAVKTYDMTGRNEWAAQAVTWITTREAAKDFAACEKAIKALVPADAIKCAGHGISVSRNKAGSLSIKELA